MPSTTYRHPARKQSGSILTMRRPRERTIDGIKVFWKLQSIQECISATLSNLQHAIAAIPFSDDTQCLSQFTIHAKHICENESPKMTQHTVVKHKLTLKIRLTLYITADTNTDRAWLVITSKYLKPIPHTSRWDAGSSGKVWRGYYIMDTWTTSVTILISM